MESVAWVQKFKLKHVLMMVLVDHVTYGTPEILNRGSFRQKRRQQMLTIKCNDNAFNANDEVDKKTITIYDNSFLKFQIKCPHNDEARICPQL